MPKKVVEEKIIPTVAARKMLEAMNRELNQFQRRTLDYATAFSKIDPKDADKVINGLSKILDISPKELVQIVNCMPETVEELRVFLPRHKLIETPKLQEALKVLKEYSK